MLEFTVMEEVGVVISIDGVMAKVAVPRKSVCEGCTSTACKPGDQSMEIEALNKVNAGVGQKVKVITKSYTYLKGGSRRLRPISWAARAALMAGSTSAGRAVATCRPSPKTAASLTRGNF